MGVNVVLQNRNGSITQYSNVTEVELPLAEGGTKVFGLGGSTGFHVAPRQGVSRKVQPTRQNPAQETDLDLTAVVSYTVPAGCEIKQVDYVVTNVGYYEYVTDPTDPNEDPKVLVSGTESLWNDTDTDYQRMITRTDTDNPDGTTTIRIYYTPFAVGTLARAWVESAFISGRVIGGTFFACANMVVSYYEI